jgi:hypothetical protein
MPDPINTASYYLEIFEIAFCVVCIPYLRIPIFFFPFSFFTHTFLFSWTGVLALMEMVNRCNNYRRREKKKKFQFLKLNKKPIVTPPRPQTDRPPTFQLQSTEKKKKKKQAQKKLKTCHIINKHITLHGICANTYVRLHIYI